MISRPSWPRPGGVCTVQGHKMALARRGGSVWRPPACVPQSSPSALHHSQRADSQTPDYSTCSL
eukprot:8739168-Pyramimonas_sp.AAC.1